MCQNYFDFLKKMPKISFSEENAGKTPVILPVFSDEFSLESRKIFRGLSTKQKRAVRRFIADFPVKKSGFLPIFCGADAPVFVNFLGEKRDEIARRDVRENAENVPQKIKKYGFDEVLVVVGGLDDELSRAFFEGIVFGNYEFSAFFGKKKKEAQKKSGEKFPQKWIFFGKNQPERKVEVEKIAAGIALAKDIINTPPSIARPSFVEKTAREIAKNDGVSIKVLGEKDLEKLNCGGILAVGRASKEESRLIILEYAGGEKDEKPIALVGKGVTFDTGGHNIKGRFMRWMKQDLGGAATVLGAFSAISALKIKKNVVAVIPTVENMVNADAYFPDDILKMYNGITVEVDNTDAEGRLILADALAYADDKIAPRAMVDLATLTGACVYAVGDDFTAGLSTDTNLFAALKKSSENVDEPLWELPLHARYEKALKSATADLVNCSDGLKPGTIEGGLFLKNFVKKETPWCHLDIASVAFDEKIGLATGRDVRLLIDFAKNF